LARLLSILLVVGLLGGTAAAFAVTEGLKLEKTPIVGTRVDKVFSPVCNCPSRVAHIRFALRKTDHLTVTIVDSGHRTVRTLVTGARYRHGQVRLAWDGRDDTGRLVPDGAYEPSVHLAGDHRTIVLPNPIRVDTVAPRVLLFKVARPVVSPDGDGHHDSLGIRYVLSEPAHARLYVDGKLNTRQRFEFARGQLRWSALSRMRPLPAGSYSLTLAAEDAAGNIGAETKPLLVTVRYIALPAHRIVVNRKARFHVTVRTDAHAFRWQLGKRRGIAHDTELVLRAPKRPGVYRLLVVEHGHAAQVAVVVRKRK
jgi:hypothetical protein